MISIEELREGGMLLIDKPYRWTSFDVVKKIRNKFGIKKVGHAGTLDPLATGLLIICTGKMTKQIDSYQNLDKVYTGQLVLGKTTPSIDLETNFDQECDTSHLKCSEVENAAQAFNGWINQVPPAFSAIKVNGQRLYKSARKGEYVNIDPRKVCINEFSITGCQIPEIDFRISCSKGTYIRSLVRDLGQNLKVGAHLTSLKRTQIGDHQLKDAFSLRELIERFKSGLEQ